jgi:hypothetical protein
MNKSIIVLLVCVFAAAAVILYFKLKASGTSGIVLEDPSKILFSTPTLCDLAPTVDSQPVQPVKDDFILHEDDWRQIEFVASKDEAYLANLVQEVGQFERSNRVDVGWKNVFVRKEHPTPLKTLGLSFHTLVESMEPHAEVHSMFLSNGSSSARVSGGFSFQVQHLGIMYGQRQEDSILELGFEPLRTSAPADSALAALSGYCTQNHLLMMDWYQRKLVNFNEHPDSWGPAH